MWVYKLYLNDMFVTEYGCAGIAQISFNTYCDCSDYIAELHQVWVGDDFDPVLHQTVVQRDKKRPPCSEPCPYKRNLGGGFNAAPRPTAFRTEVMDPSDRCGWKLKPGHVGGHDYDYGFCIRCSQ